MIKYILDRKAPIIIVIFIILILASGFVLYKLTSNINDTESNPDEINLPSENTEDQVKPEMEIETTNGGGLIICSDQCGDGFCQADVSCEGGSLNCICKESYKDCPQDCKQ